jgi:hypothetical protein
MKRELTDVPISGTCNVIKKATEKILKYKDLTTEIQRMWNVTTKVIPVITKGNWSHLKIVQKITRKAPQNNSRTGHCTRTAGSADVLWSACSMQCNHSTDAILCTLETLFVAGT